MVFRRNKFVSDERGYVAVLAILVLSMICLLGAGSLNLAAQQGMSALREQNTTKAKYIAEVGITRALSYLAGKQIYPAPGFENFILNNESFEGGVIESVKVEGPETVDGNIYYTIKSKAAYPADANSAFKARKALEARIVIVSDSFIRYGGGTGIKSGGNVKLGTFWGTNTSPSIVAGKDLTLDISWAVTKADLYSGRDAKIYLNGFIFGAFGEGDIKAGRNIFIDNNSWISSWKGDAWAGGDYSTEGNFSLTGSVYERCKEIPGLPIPEFPDISRNNTQWVNALAGKAMQSNTFYLSEDDFYKNMLDVKFGEPQEVNLYLPFMPPILLWVRVPVLSRSITLADKTVYFVEGATSDNPFDFTEKEELDQAYNAIVDDKRQEVRQKYGDVPIVFEVQWSAWTYQINIPAGVNSTFVADKINIQDNEFFSNYNWNGSGTVGAFAINDSYGSVRVSSSSQVSFGVLSARNINRNSRGKFSWIVTKDDIDLDTSFQATMASAKIPYGTPIGYKIVSWREE